MLVGRRTLERVRLRWRQTSSMLEFLAAELRRIFCRIQWQRWIDVQLIENKLSCKTLVLFFRFWLNALAWYFHYLLYPAEVFFVWVAFVAYVCQINLCCFQFHATFSSLSLVPLRLFVLHGCMVMISFHSWYIVFYILEQMKFVPLIFCVDQWSFIICDNMFK